MAVSTRYEADGTVRLVAPKILEQKLFEREINK